MTQVLLKLLPLAFGAAISPIPFTIIVLILTQRDRPLRHSIAFAAGELLPLLAISVPAMITSRAIVKLGSSPGDKWSAYFDIACGLALAFLAVFTTLRHSAKKSGELETDDGEADDGETGEVGAGEEPGAAKKGALRYILMGLAAMLTNFSTIVIFIPAVKVIAEAGLPSTEKVMALVILLTITLSLTIVPITIYALAPERAAKILLPVGNWFKAHSHTISLVLMVVFSVYLLVKGIRRL